MVQTNKYKKLSVDTNIVIGLALLYLRGEKELINNNLAGGGSKIANKQYAEDIKLLQTYVDKRHIQIVLTPQVMYELTYKAKNVDEHGNTTELSKEDLAWQNLKNLALEYLERMPKIKIAKIARHCQAEFNEDTEFLVDEYVNHYHIFEKNKKGNAPSDARIMAQATVLGLDFITRDHHFTSLSPCSKKSRAEKIYMTNCTYSDDTPTKVIPLSELESTMSNIGNHGQLVRKKYFQENNTDIDYSLLSYEEYVNDRHLGR